MPKLQGPRGKGDRARQARVRAPVPDVRTISTPSQPSFDPFRSGWLSTTVLERVKVRSPNKVVWGRGAAIRASKERAALRYSACVHVMALIGPSTRKLVKLGMLHAHIRITQLAPRLFDDDNFVGAAKAIRDGIADAFELRDDAKSLSWFYAQEKRKVHGIRIEVSTQ